jgi:hypothetical protein
MQVDCRNHQWKKWLQRECVAGGAVTWSGQGPFFLPNRAKITTTRLLPRHHGKERRRPSTKAVGGGLNAARAFRMAAQGCHHAKNALGAFYRRIQARCGGPKAIVATARKIAERVYRLLKHGEAYVRQAEAAYAEQYRLRILKGMTRKAATLGYKLVPAGSE